MFTTGETRKIFTTGETEYRRQFKAWPLPSSEVVPGTRRKKGMRKDIHYFFAIVKACLCLCCVVLHSRLMALPEL